MHRQQHEPVITERNDSDSLPPDQTLPTVQAVALVRHTGRVAGRTDVGRVRPQNEDQFVVARLARHLDIEGTSLPHSGSASIAEAQGTLLAVADGMGGHQSGDLASAVTVDTMLHHVLHRMPWPMTYEDGQDDNLLQGLGKALQRCQARLAQVAARKGIAHHRMGTTLTLAYVAWPCLFVAHAGDSRLYLWRHGELRRVTHDHTLGERMRELQQAEGAANPMAAPELDHVLVNVVGGNDDAVATEAHRLVLERGDRLLLCSDGLTNHVDDVTIRGAMAENLDPNALCAHLIEKANADGGSDNVTVVAAYY
jgi:protein phosphatase